MHTSGGPLYAWALSSNGRPGTSDGAEELWHQGTNGAGGTTSYIAAAHDWSEERGVDLHGWTGSKAVETTASRVGRAADQDMQLWEF